MSCTIHRQRLLQSQPATYLLQVPVDAQQSILVLPSRVVVPLTNNTKQVRRRNIGTISLQNTLHTRLPMYTQLLVGLPTTIQQHIATQIFLLQESNINKRHTTCIETKHKHIASKQSRRMLIAVNQLQPLDNRQRNSPLGSPLNRSRHPPERSPIRHQLIIHSPVISRPQMLQIERDRIGRQPHTLKVTFIPLHKFTIHIGKRHIHTTAITHQAVQRRQVSLTRAYLPTQPITSHNPSHKIKKCNTPTPHGSHIINNIAIILTQPIIVLRKTHTHIVQKSPKPHVTQAIPLLQSYKIIFSHNKTSKSYVAKLPPQKSHKTITSAKSRGEEINIYRKSQ